MWTRRFYGRKTIARATHGLMSNNKNEPGRPLTSEKTRNYYYHFLNAHWVRCRDKTEPLLIIRLGPSTRYASIVTLRASYSAGLPWRLHGYVWCCPKWEKRLTLRFDGSDAVGKFTKTILFGRRQHFWKTVEILTTDLCSNNIHI